MAAGLCESVPPGQSPRSRGEAELHTSLSLVSFRCRQLRQQRHEPPSAAPRLAQRHSRPSDRLLPAGLLRAPLGPWRWPWEWPRGCAHLWALRLQDCHQQVGGKEWAAEPRCGPAPGAHACKARTECGRGLLSGERSGGALLTSLPFLTSLDYQRAPPPLSARCCSRRALGSAPLVAGAAALHLEAHPGATPAQVRRQLLDSAAPNTVTMAGPGTPTLLLYTNPMNSSGAGSGGGSAGGGSSGGLSGGTIALICVAAAAGERHVLGVIRQMCLLWCSAPTLSTAS